MMITSLEKTAMETDAIIYFGGMIALGSILGIFVLIDYFQRKNAHKHKPYDKPSESS